MNSLTAHSTKRLFEEATRRLSEAEVPEPRASAEILMSELLDIRRGEIPFHGEPLTPEQRESYEDMISRRLNREPVQRILGYAYFRNLKLFLDDETLIPRPDTESVVDVALEWIDRSGASRVLDIGTGTGAIAISIAQERPACDVHASDVSEAALEVARRNATENDANMTFHLSDIASELAGLSGSVGLIVSNPPYIESPSLNELQPEVRDWDPRTALDGGPDGLYFYRRILTGTRHLLKPDTRIVLEVGDGQAEEVGRIGASLGFTDPVPHPDLAGSVRTVTMRWPG